MTRKILTIVFALLTVCSFTAWAQQDYRPCRTPEEEALKQTQMLQRELELTQQQVDTVYQIHLKYALLRQESNTRAEALERMNRMTEELLAVMTRAQQELFLNKQMGHGSRTTTPVRPVTPMNNYLKP